jgi:ATP-dependent Clp protease ATP-binding subunit ClpA
VFERFTDRSRRAVALAQEEARRLRHHYIGTEHLLLGLIDEGEGVAAKALDSLGVSREDVRLQVEEIIGRGFDAPPGHVPFTPRAKKVLELSLREALQLGHNYIGTEHILLGVIREGEGVAAQVLQKLGADLNRVRQQVIQLLSGYAGGKSGARRREVLDRLTDDAWEALGRARAYARDRGDGAVEPVHLLAALLDAPNVLDDLLGHGDCEVEHPRLSVLALAFLTAAVDEHSTLSAHALADALREHYPTVTQAFLRRLET